MPEPLPHDPSESAGSARASKEARSRLRQRIHRDPGDTAARAELAQLHRDAGHADQAGRWGLLVPGWTTPAERRALAVWIVRSGRHDRSQVLRLLSIPSSRSETPGALDPAGARLQLLFLVEEELVRLRKETSTHPVVWLRETPLLVVPAVLIGAAVGSVFSGITLAFGGPHDEPAQPTWFPSSWAEIWTDVGLLTLAGWVLAMAASVVVLATRMPAVLRHRSRLRRRERSRAHRAARHDLGQGPRRDRDG
ncbi:DUF6584 family protein [uncultured Frigoribacterium sp.]|uniref:DUF6584 family protein n=1 Tax=uncultured Frigoribacterium sp. TaxID=335377 RepID=UPI0028D8EDAD|nr:DUF6584 family protein [uncultured Frigoribacterium sp.]